MTLQDILKAGGEERGRANAAEQWRPAPDYEGRYEVSSLGRIRSLPRIEQSARGVRRVKGGLLKPMVHSQGYLQVSLRRDGKLKTYRLHRLIALAFHGDKRNALHCEVAHLDGNPGNARADNLKWVSRRENLSHKLQHGTHQRGERHPAAKLTNAQADDIRRLRGRASYATLAERYGVGVHTIDDVMRGKRYVTELSRSHRISRFAPTLTHRVHYGAPKPFGHRQWLKLEGR